MTDDQDNPGIRVPPPLIYLLPLAAGLVLDRRLHLPSCHAGWREGWDWCSWAAGRHSTRGPY